MFLRLRAGRGHVDRELRRGPQVPAQPEIRQVGPVVPAEGQVLYHGSPSGELTKIDTYRHTNTWREGIGFYVTEDPEVAKMYADNMRREGAKEGQGRVNQVRITSKNIVDFDAPAAEHRKMWEAVARDIELIGADGYGSWAELWEAATSDLGKDPTNMQMYQEMAYLLRDQYNGLTSDTMYNVEEALTVQGVEVTTHIEGKKRGKPHRVWVVRDPDAVELIQKFAPDIQDNIKRLSESQPASLPPQTWGSQKPTAVRDEIPTQEKAGKEEKPAQPDLSERPDPAIMSDSDMLREMRANYLLSDRKSTTEDMQADLSARNEELREELAARGHDSKEIKGVERGKKPAPMDAETVRREIAKIEQTYGDINEFGFTSRDDLLSRYEKEGNHKKGEGLSDYARRIACKGAA